MNRELRCAIFYIFSLSLLVKALSFVLLDISLQLPAMMFGEPLALISVLLALFVFMCFYFAGCDFYS